METPIGATAIGTAELAPAPPARLERIALAEEEVNGLTSLKTCQKIAKSLKEIQKN